MAFKEFSTQSHFLHDFMLKVIGNRQNIASLDTIPTTIPAVLCIVKIYHHDF